MGNSKKITAFHGIFEQKLSMIVKKIKKIRRNPDEKPQVKQLLTEAKKLRKLIKKERKKSVQHTIEIPVRIEDGQVVLAQTSSSSAVKVLDTRLAGGLLIVEFEISQQEKKHDTMGH